MPRERDDLPIEVTPPDFDRALHILKTDIWPTSGTTAESRGELAAAWKAVNVGCSVDKPAARVFLKHILGREPQQKDKFLRHFLGLVAADGHVIADIAHKAQDQAVVHPPAQ